MSDVEPSNIWKHFREADLENQKKLVSSVEEEEFIDIDVNEEKFRVVLSRNVSDKEIELKSLVPPDILKEQLYQDESVGRYFNEIIGEAQVRKTSADMVDLLSIMVHTLNNMSQLRKFITEHSSPKEVATLFENYKLSTYLNTWKTSMLKGLSMKDGRIEIHLNEIVAAIHSTRNHANRLCQNETEHARKLYNEAVKQAVSKRDAELATLGPLTTLSDLTGSYISQSDRIKSESRKVWSQIPQDERPEDFLEWAQVWWMSEKTSQMATTLESLKTTPEFVKFFTNRWSFREQDVFVPETL